MAKQFVTIPGDMNGFTRSSNIYPPGTATFVTNGQVVRSFTGGIFTITALCFRIFVTLEADERIISAALLLPVADLNNANARSVNGEYRTYAGDTASTNYTDQSVATAFSIGLGVIPAVGIGQPFAGYKSIALSAINNIPRNGYAGFRLTISGGQPNGKNNITLDNAVNPYPVLSLITSRTQQAVPLEPLSGGYDATQTLPLKWRHVNGAGLAQGRYVVEYSINGGAFAVLSDALTPNQFFVVPANTFTAGQTIRWRVTTYAVGEETLASPVSQESQIFMGAAVNVPNVTAPNGQIATATPTITWTSAQGDRTAWQARIVRLSDGAIIASSAKVPGQALLWNPVNENNAPIALANNVNYQAQVRVWASAQDVAGGFGTRNFNTVFNPPPAPTVTADPQHDNGLTMLTIVNPASGGGQDVAIYNRIKVSDDGNVTYQLLRDNWPLNTPYPDCRAESKKLRYYKVEAVGTAGGVNLSIVASAKLNIRKGFFIHDVFNAVPTLLNIENYRGTMKGNWYFPVDYVEYETPEGTRRVALEAVGSEVENFDGSFTILTRATPFNPVNKWPLFDALIRRRSVYCIRPFSGKVYIGKIAGLGIDLVETDGMQNGFNVTLHLEHIDISDSDV